MFHMEKRSRNTLIIIIIIIIISLRLMLSVTWFNDIQDRGLCLVLHEPALFACCSRLLGSMTKCIRRTRSLLALYHTLYNTLKCMGKRTRSSTPWAVYLELSRVRALDMRRSTDIDLISKVMLSCTSPREGHETID